MTIKPNTTGMDYTYNVYIDLSQKPLDMVGVTNKSDNLQMPINVANWTPVAIQLCCCASVCENKLDTLPETTMQYRSSVMTEMRSNTELKTLIQYAIPRQPGSQAQVSLNTCDPSNTNQRKVRPLPALDGSHGTNPRVWQSMTRITVSRFHLCAFCTNILEVSQEEMKTVGVVTHRMNPGSGPPTNKRAKNGSFNQAECSSFSGRKNRTHNLESVINVLMYTHMFALSLPALMNRSSIIPYEINPSVLGVLDWLAFWIKEHMQRSFETVVFDSYKRMCDGYEARQVTKSLWATCIMVIPQCSTMEEAFQRVVQVQPTHKASPAPADRRLADHALQRAAAERGSPGVLQPGDPRSEHGVPADVGGHGPTLQRPGDQDQPVETIPFSGPGYLDPRPTPVAWSPSRPKRPVPMPCPSAHTCLAARPTRGPLAASTGWTLP